MTAFQNIIDLRFAVSDLVGNRAISDVFNRLVEMAERDFDSRLRTRHQITDATLTFDEGICPLPPDFLEMIVVCDAAGMPRKFQVGAFNITIPAYSGVVEAYSGDVTAQYYARLPTITNSNTACNWLLEQYPTVYLYGVGMQAAKHLRDVDVATQISSLYGEALQLLRVDDERARYSVSAVRVKGLTP
jgi:hypothetical protein